MSAAMHPGADAPVEGPGPVDPSPSPGRRGARFRLRDLDGRGRLLAALLGVALLAAPLRAALVEVQEWSPQADDALIALRAQDTGTGRTPLVGQPSTSGSYGSDTVNTAHPGPAGLWVLAPGSRLLGPSAGLLLTTALVTGGSVLVAAWTIFRQAGPRAGAVGSVVLAGAMWTAGGAALVDPLSSNLGRFPLVALAVLVWALLCGDLRLAPLTVAVWSFAAQQHLSVLPAAAVLATVAAAAIGVTVVHRARHDGPAEARAALRWVAGAALVGLVLWAPVLIQQVRSGQGNLALLADYSGDPARVDLGYRSGAEQVVGVVGAPLVARPGVTGWDLYGGPAGPAVALAVTATAALVAGAWWARRREPRLLALVACVGAAAVAGVVTAANVPDSLEKGRLNFYHWAFALSVVEAVGLAWLTVLAVGSLRPRWGRRGSATTRGPSPGVVGAAAVVVTLVAAVAPLAVDRDSDQLATFLPERALDQLVGELEAEGGLADEGPLLVVPAGDDRFSQVTDTVRARLLDDGYDVRFAPRPAGFVHPDHVLAPCTVDRALVLGLGDGSPLPLPGREVASVEVAPELDRRALGRLAAQAEGQDVDLGPDLEAALGRLPGGEGDIAGARIVFNLGPQPSALLRDRETVALFADHPPQAPALDHDDLVRLRDSFPDRVAGVPITDITAHLVDGAQLRAVRPDLTSDCP